MLIKIIAPLSKYLSNFNIFSVWGDNITQRFYSAFQAITDYGACCLIIPYLDLVKHLQFLLEIVEFKDFF